MTDTAIAAPVARSVDAAAKSAAARLQDDEQGATAVEFALIATPFMAMLMGIISIGLYFFTVLELENAVWSVSREIRVGKYGQGSDGYSVDGSGNPVVKEDELRNRICKKLRSDDTTCNTKLRIILQSQPTITHADAGTMQQPNCRKTDGSGQLITNSEFQVTDASYFTILTACYAWEFGGKLPFFKIGNMPDGSFLMQASFAFVNEGYR